MKQDLKKIENAILGDLHKAKKLSEELTHKLQAIPPNQKERDLRHQRHAIRSEYREKLWAVASMSSQRSAVAKEALAELEPEVLEERADFTGGGIDELAWSQRVGHTTPDRLPSLATMLRRDGNRAAARVLRRELARRTDIDGKTKAAVLDQLDSIPLPEGVLESAELAVSVLSRAKDVEFTVREALGHVSPVEKLAAARACQGQQSHVRKWGVKPSLTTAAQEQSDDRTEPLSPISGTEGDESGDTESTAA